MICDRCAKPIDGAAEEHVKDRPTGPPVVIRVHPGARCAPSPQRTYPVPPVGRRHRRTASGCEGADPRG